MPPKRKWILASASPRRQEILSRLGMQFQVDPSRIEEPPRRPGETPSRYVIRAARLKARETAIRHPDGLIIAADTVVVLGQHLLGKPASREEAAAMLYRLGGRWHEVWSGLCLLDIGTGHARSASCSSRVHFRTLAAPDIEWYLQTGEYRDKAGAYAVQGCASLFIGRIEGCYFNIVGFPVATFERLCTRSGICLKDHLNVKRS
ncbi:MAG: septum formation protein Maf [Acidobacteria bacterium]|nr:septum formation protein Maf [Acidobacteriota bacterium]